MSRHYPPPLFDLSAVLRQSALPRLVAILFLVASGGACLASTVIHDFAGAPNDGRNSSGGIVIADNLLYGTTGFGGPTNGSGVIFRMNPDGSGYTILHTFYGGTNDGARPAGRLLVSGSTIYGVTQNGGPSNFGTVYSMDITGSNFKVIHSFTGGANDGEFPNAPLVLVNSTLYGVCELGGPDNLGIIYQIDTGGTGFTVLHAFATGPTDGHLPFGGLTLSATTLYGVTAQGGNSNNAGTIFKIDINGSGYALLHQFSGVQGDGYNPEHNLTLIGNILYGVTNQGGTAGTGTIFKIGIGGNGYAVLYSFEGATGNDGHPSSALTLVADHLIGATDPIDNSIPDLVYSVRSDGSGFGVLYRFNGPTSEGREPGGDFAVIGSTLYGATGYGGSAGNGVVYTLDLPLLKITSVMRPAANEFSLTGQAFPNSGVTIEVIPDLETGPESLYPTTADGNGVFHFDDLNAAGSLKFYRATSP